jgi:hypothetical protein
MRSVRRRRCRGEGGASLLLALGFLALFGALIPAIVNLSTTNLVGTTRLKEQRSGVYASDGAVDAAIQYLRLNPGCGRPFASCPSNTFTADVDGTTATVTITPLGTWDQLDRKVRLQAILQGAPTKVRTEATVVVRDSDPTKAAGFQNVDVQSWTYTH